MTLFAGGSLFRFIPVQASWLISSTLLLKFYFQYPERSWGSSFQSIPGSVLRFPHLLPVIQQKAFTLGCCKDASSTHVAFLTFADDFSPNPHLRVTVVKSCLKSFRRRPEQSHSILPEIIRYTVVPGSQSITKAFVSTSPLGFVQGTLSEKKTESKANVK